MGIMWNFTFNISEIVVGGIGTVFGQILAGIRASDLDDDVKVSLEANTYLIISAIIQALSEKVFYQEFQSVLKFRYHITKKSFNHRY